MCWTASRETFWNMCRMNDRSRLELFCPGIAALILLPHITVLRSAIWPSGDPGQLHLAVHPAVSASAAPGVHPAQVPLKTARACPC